MKQLTILITLILIATVGFSQMYFGAGFGVSTKSEIFKHGEFGYQTKKLDYTVSFGHYKTAINSKEDNNWNTLEVYAGASYKIKFNESESFLAPSAGIVYCIKGNKFENGYHYYMPQIGIAWYQYIFTYTGEHSISDMFIRFSANKSFNYRVGRNRFEISLIGNIYK